MLTEILFGIAVCLITFFIRRARQKNGQTPPGPFQWPFIGNLRLVRRLSREFRGQHRAFLELSKRYGSNLLSLHLGGSNVIVVSGYEQIHTILKGEEFDGRPWNEFIKLRNMGHKKGIAMSDGPEWREVRSWLVRSLWHLGFGRSVSHTHMKEELQLILDSISEGGVASMTTIMAPAMINVIWRIAAGKRFAEKTDSRLEYFLDLMKRRTKAFDAAGGILSMFPWMRYIAPEASGYNILMKLNLQIKSLLMEAINDHKKPHVVGAATDDLIDLFLKEIDDRKGTDTVFNDDQLFLILLDLFIAGTVTTKTTLDFLFLRMVHHQDMQRRLHEEIDSVIESDRLPDLSDRPKMPYAEAIITESQRLQTIIPITGPRRVVSECYVDGYRIPKESFILINIFSIHMDPQHFPNPDSFDPERFIKNGVHVPDEKLIFFGRGHRRCPAEFDARAAVFLFFVGIMQRFQLLPAPGQGELDVEPDLGLTISPKPYKVLLVPRHPVTSANECNAKVFDQLSTNLNGLAESLNGITNISNGLANNSNGSAKHTNGSANHSNGSENHSNGSANRSNGTASHINESANHSNGSANHSNGSANHANGSANHSNGTGSHLNGSANHSNGSANHSNGLANHPNGLANHPNGLANH